MWDFLRHRMTIVGFPLTALLMLGLVFIGVDPIIKSSQGAEKITKGGIDGYIDAHNHLVGRFRSRSGSLLLILLTKLVVKMPGASSSSMNSNSTAAEGGAFQYEFSIINSEIKFNTLSKSSLLL